MRLNNTKRFFEDEFFLEVSKIGLPSENMHYDLVLDLAESTNTPVVATHQACFLDKDGFEAHELKVCIQTKQSLSDLNRQSHHTVNQYFKSTEEMTELFADVPGAVENTFEIAKKCNLRLDIHTTHMPAYPNKIAESTIDDHLRNIALEGLKKRTNGNISPQYQERLDTELEIIRKTEFAGYFLIVADIIGWSKSQGIAVGPGRGSGAGSLVAYSLQITSVDPIQHDLLFERFLNLERVSPPDFDIDFCVIERERVIEYVSERYGADQVAQIATYNTMAAKAAVRFVGRAIRPDYLFYDTLARLIPDDLNTTLAAALKKKYGTQAAL